MSGTTRTEQKDAHSKGFAEVGTEAWLRECEALLSGVPADWNTVAIGKDRLRGLIDEARISIGLRCARCGKHWCECSY